MSQEVHTRPFRLRAVVAALIALLLCAVPTAAFAHDELVGTQPERETQIAELPAELVLTFSGVLLDEPGATEVVVTDAAGTSLVAGDPVLDGTRLTQPVEGSAAGAVTVIWRVVSSDGHPVSGEYAFTVGDGTSTPVGTENPLPGPPMADTGMGTVWIILGVVGVALAGALLAVLIARARGRRED